MADATEEDSKDIGEQEKNDEDDDGYGVDYGASTGSLFPKCPSMRCLNRRMHYE